MGSAITLTSMARREEPLLGGILDSVVVRGLRANEVNIVKPGRDVDDDGFGPSRAFVRNP